MTGNLAFARKRSTPVSAFLQQLMSDNFPKKSTSSLWWQNGFWIGLTDVVREGTWVWINNVTEVEVM